MMRTGFRRVEHAKRAIANYRPLAAAFLGMPIAPTPTGTDCAWRPAVARLPAESLGFIAYDPDPDRREKEHALGFVSSIISPFDPHFFGIAPRDANTWIRRSDADRVGLGGA